MQVKGSRKSHGSALAEFAPGLCMFLAVFIPLIHISIFPIRLYLAQSCFESLTHDLALSQKRSLVEHNLKGSWQVAFLKNCGIEMQNTSFAIHLKSLKGRQSQLVEGNNPVSEKWLPGGVNYPCLCRLIGKTTLVLHPVLGADASSGILRPVEIEMSSQALWENREFNPASGALYLNE